MRIAVVNLTQGGLSGGYWKYLENMAPLLRGDTRVERLDIFMPPGLEWPGADESATYTWPAGDARQGYARLKAQLRQLTPDVVFIPTARWLDCGRIPTVVMVRNMEPLSVPFGGNSALEGARNLVRAWAARVACRRATRVIAVSQHVYDFLATRWKIGRGKIGLVYHGIETPPSRSQAIRPQALQGSDLRHFIFTAGSIRPARGLEDLIGAMAVLAAHDEALTLVIGGRPDPGSQSYMRKMQQLAAERRVSERVVWAGQLNALEMSWCFYHCAAFVTTSRAEACPNTALEAMSHGCAVVSTRQPPMPEFFRELAWYYHPRDARDLAEKIKLALDAWPDQLEARRAAARARAHDFTWRETAMATVEQFVLAQTSGLASKEDGQT